MKNLAIDIGNVICHVNFDNFFKTLSEELNISLSDCNHFLNRTQKLHDLGLTQLKDELSDHFKIKSEHKIENILYEWNRCIDPDSDVINELNNLKNKCDIILVSNMNIEHADYIRNILSKKYPIFNEVKNFLSYEVGARKPTYIYYQSLLSMYPEFKNCIYIDDLDDNLKVGKLFGLNSIKFDINEYKKNKLDNLLIGSTKINLFFKEIEKLINS